MKWSGTWPVDMNIELNPTTWTSIIERMVRIRYATVRPSRQKTTAIPTVAT